MALNRLWMPSPHHSARSGSVRLIVLHTTEGAQTIESLANWFANPSAKVSSHVGADNKRRGTIAEYVRRDRAAWAQGNYNSAATSIEMCTPAGAANGWSRSYWLNSQGWLLDNCAEWIAEEARHYGIPIVKLSASQAQGSGRGLCGHVDIQPRDRTDPGPGFPWDYVISKAAGGAPPASAPPNASEGDRMTPAVVFFKDDIYRACRGSDQRVYYSGPDTKGAWHMVDPASKSISGVSMAVSPTGSLVISYVNGAGNICSYRRASGGGSWAWSNQGGNAK
jgi:hypothetical protein